LPKCQQSDGDFVTTQNIKLYRESTCLNLERFAEVKTYSTKLEIRNESPN
jgi:hypothetical protein